MVANNVVVVLVLVVTVTIAMMTLNHVRFVVFVDMITLMVLHGLVVVSEKISDQSINNRQKCCCLLFLFCSLIISLLVRSTTEIDLSKRDSNGQNNIGTRALERHRYPSSIHRPRDMDSGMRGRGRFYFIINTS
jgi:hypothetical protein